MTFSPALVTEEHSAEIHEQVPAEILALSDVSARAEQPIEVEVVVNKDGDSFLVTGWARTTLLLRCARDGEMFPQAIRAKVEHLFEAPHPNSIDLTPFIREDVLLELPLNAVCQLTPDGRCPVTNEVYQPRPEASGTLVGNEVWDELSKLKPKK